MVHFRLQIFGQKPDWFWLFCLWDSYNGCCPYSRLVC